MDSTAEHTFGRGAPLRYRLRQEWDQHRYGATMERHLKTKGRYLGLVTEVDRTIGAVLAKLEQTGLAENTIVVHTSDHGDMMGAHRLFGKEVFFQEAVRVPWLVRFPGQTRPQTISQNVSHIDFAPTLLGLLGRENHGQCAGRNLEPLMRGQAVADQNVFMQWHPDKKEKALKRTRLAGRDAVRTAMNESSRAVVSPDGWKLCLRDQDKNELYNLKSDPTELRNLYTNDECKEVVSRLTGDIHRWQEQIGDPLKV
jgi:arylsulfatase A-like enzyme